MRRQATSNKTGKVHRGRIMDEMTVRAIATPLPVHQGTEVREAAGIGTDPH